jgi:hypothetical protein
MSAELRYFLEQTTHKIQANAHYFLEWNIHKIQAITHYFLEWNIHNTQANAHYFLEQNIHNIQANAHYFLQQNIQANTHYFLQQNIHKIQANTHFISFGIHAQIKIAASKIHWDTFWRVLVMAKCFIHQHGLLVVPQMESAVTNPHFCFCISFASSELNSKIIRVFMVPFSPQWQMSA